MILKQFYLNCLAHASYLVADEETRTAAVVDPQRDVDQYLEFAAAHGVSIRHVILTHFHADFLAGHLELRDRAGATIYLGKAGKAEYAFTPLGDGDAIAFGRVRIEALETPGHTPESISLLVYDLAASADVPHAVLTGDTLFVGDVGRPDLRAALGWSAADLGALLYDSLRNKLLRLPDPTLVYPAHGAGSLCGKALSRETVSTIGEQRRANYALQPMSREAFLDLVTADQPDAPAYFVYDAVLNTKERPTLDEALPRQLKPLTLDQVLDAQATGAQVLDTRDPAEFAAAHLAGSVNIGLVGQYATWAGTLLGREAPIVLVTDPGAEEESAKRLGRIGFDLVAGYLEGGLASARHRSDLIRTTDRLAPAVAAGRLAPVVEERRAPTIVAERRAPVADESERTAPGEDAPRAGPDAGQAPVLIDVRAPGERAQKWIDGSLHVPLNRLPERLSDIPADRPLLVHCAGGYRSSIAASLLQRAGRTDVAEIAGGITAWENAGLPVVTGSPA